MSSKLSTSWKTRIAKARKRNIVTESNAIFEVDDVLEPVAVGSHGNAAGVEWYDYPISMESVGRSLWHERSFAGFWKQMTVFLNDVEFYSSATNTHSLLRRVFVAGDKSKKIEDAKNTRSTGWGLLKGHGEWGTIRNTVPQNRLPWVPALLRDESMRQERASHEEYVRKIGNEGCKRLWKGHLLRMIGFAFLGIFLLTGFAIAGFMSLNYVQSGYDATKKVSIIAVCCLTISIAILVCGNVYISTRTKSCLLVIQDIASDVNNKISNNGINEKGVITRFDLLVSEEHHGSFRHGAGNEIVMLWGPDYKQPSFWARLSGKNTINYFLRFSSYPLVYHQYFQSDKVIDDIKSLSGSSDSESQILNQRDGVVCNPFCNSSVAMQALARLPYRNYVEDSSYAPHGVYC